LQHEEDWSRRKRSLRDEDIASEEQLEVAHSKAAERLESLGDVTQVTQRLCGRIELSYALLHQSNEVAVERLH